MPMKKTPENSHFARFLSRFIKRQRGMLKIYNEISVSFQKQMDTVEDGESGKEKIKKLVKHYEDFESIKNSFFKYFDKKATTEYAVEDISDRIMLYSAIPKKNLVEILATTSYEHELMHHEMLYLSSSILFFIENYTDVAVRDILNDSRRQTIAKQRESINRQCLEHCLDVLINRIQRPLKETDYLQFIRLVEELYPTMPHPKKARLTKEEKKLPKSQQEEILKEKQSNKWKLSSLRKFFESETGLKATTKKMLSLKS